jgi:hypothetical protein
MIKRSGTRVTMASNEITAILFGSDLCPGIFAEAEGRRPSDVEARNWLSGSSLGSCDSGLEVMMLSRSVLNAG